MGLRPPRIAPLLSRGDGFLLRWALLRWALLRWGKALPLLLIAGSFALSGCHSAYVQADIHNASGQSVSLLEVDYPSASFGKETLAAGGDYRYRFKIQGSGPSKVLWTDATHKDHTVAGPELQEGQQGTLAITITGPTATWTAHLHTQ